MSAKKFFLYLFTGDEFLRRYKIESLLNELLPLGTESLRLTNLSRLDPEELDWHSVFTQASTPSLMGGNLVFWVSRSEKIKKGDWPAFEVYCAKPVPKAYFIFEADELSDSHPLLKLVERVGKHIHSGAQSRESGVQLLRSKLAQSGKTITPEAWEMLEDQLAASQNLMDLALDQLILYSKGSVIDKTQVLALTATFFQYEPFDLTEALASRNVPEAMKVFHYLYDLSGDLTSVVGLIHWQLRRIWQAKRILAQGGRAEDVARKVRIPPYRLASFLDQVKRFELETVERFIEKLWRFDWNSKRGMSDGPLALEVLFAEIA